MLAPVIQRASSDARKATTAPISSGLPIRFNACIPKVASRPASVFAKIRHIRVDYAGCDRVYAYAARTENSRPVLDQSLKCAFSGGVSKDRKGFPVPAYPPPFGLRGKRQQQCLSPHQERARVAEQEEWATDVCSKEVVKILYGVISNRQRFLSRLDQLVARVSNKPR